MESRLCKFFWGYSSIHSPENQLYDTLNISPIQSLEWPPVIHLFKESFDENPIKTITLLFYLRDCRGGGGEKEIFRQCLRWLSHSSPKYFKSLIPLIADYGSYKDYLFLFGTPVENEVISFYSHQLAMDQWNLESGKGSITLAAKWAPTENGAHDRQYQSVLKLSKALGVRKSEYRKNFLTPLRQEIDIPEKKMCSGQWNDIHRMSARSWQKYSRAINRHQDSLVSDTSQMTKDQISKDQTSKDQMTKDQIPKIQTINPVNQTPFDILSPLFSSCPINVNLQWNQYVMSFKQQSKGYFLPILNCNHCNQKPQRIAISLTLLLANSNIGILAKKWIYGFGGPYVRGLKGGTIEIQLDEIKNVLDGNQNSLNGNQNSLNGNQNSLNGNQLTLNLLSICEHILKLASNYNIPPEHIPNGIIIFNCENLMSLDFQAIIEKIDQKYNLTPYRRPTIIIWNLCGMIPILEKMIPRFTVVSGMNPSLLNLILQKNYTNQEELINDLVSQPRYVPVISACQQV